MSKIVVCPFCCYASAVANASLRDNRHNGEDCEAAAAATKPQHEFNSEYEWVSWLHVTFEVSRVQCTVGYEDWKESKKHKMDEHYSCMEKWDYNTCVWEFCAKASVASVNVCNGLSRTAAVLGYYFQCNCRQSSFFQLYYCFLGPFFLMPHVITSR